MCSRNCELTSLVSSSMSWMACSFPDSKSRVSALITHSSVSVFHIFQPKCLQHNTWNISGYRGCHPSHTFRVFQMRLSCPWAWQEGGTTQWVLLVKAGTVASSQEKNFIKWDGKCDCFSKALEEECYPPYFPLSFPPKSYLTSICHSHLLFSTTFPKLLGMRSTEVRFFTFSSSSTLGCYQKQVFARLLNHNNTHRIWHNTGGCGWARTLGRGGPTLLFKLKC